MGDDHVKGEWKDTKGSIKEGVGKALGDRETETEGKADQAEGKVQKAWGDVKDAVKGD